MSEISVNGERRPWQAGDSVIDIVRTLTPTTEGCAVAVNDAVVPRSHWAARVIEAGDRIEVLTAVQGG
jgi:sulfur carrier protein